MNLILYQLSQKLSTDMTDISMALTPMLFQISKLMKAMSSNSEPGIN
jgi:hypothetical protein